MTGLGTIPGGSSGRWLGDPGPLGDATEATVERREGGQQGDDGDGRLGDGPDQPPGEKPIQEVGLFDPQGEEDDP